MMVREAVGEIVIENSLVAMIPGVSLTRMVKEKVPAVVGTPLSVPSVSNVRPGGRAEADCSNHV